MDTKCILLCCSLLLGGGLAAVCGAIPVTYPAKITFVCGQDNPLQDHLLMEALQQISKQACKNTTCKEIFNCFPSAPSGYYQIHAPNGSAVQVYCDMEGTNCGGEGGWTRVAYVNMTQPGATCPQGLSQKAFTGLTLCGRSGEYVGTAPPGGGCQSTVFSILGLNYCQVCGQLRGYQYGTPNAFSGNISRTIDEVYVDGVSITYGSAPRKHIWTYACYYYLKPWCPCSQGSTAQVHPFVGNDYYCETGNNVYTNTHFYFHGNDPLWDGQQCNGPESLCCTHPNMPWFLKTLGEATTKDIELRLCGNQTAEDTPLQVIELYVR